MDKATSKPINSMNESLRLCDVASIRLGHPFRGAVTQYEEGDVSVIQVKDTDAHGRIDQSSIVKTKLSTKKRPDWLETGDILFVAKGAKHHSVLLERAESRTVCSPHFFVVRIRNTYKEHIRPDFLCWQLNQSPAQHYFKKTAEGSMYLSIRRQVLENVPVKILSLFHQEHLTALHRSSVLEHDCLQKLITNRQTQLTAVALKALT